MDVCFNAQTALYSKNHIVLDTKRKKCKTFASKKMEDIEACLSAGKIPDVLKGKIELKQAENKENHYKVPNGIAIRLYVLWGKNHATQAK